MHKMVEVEAAVGGSVHFGAQGEWRDDPSVDEQAGESTPGAVNSRLAPKGSAQLQVCTGGRDMRRVLCLSRQPPSSLPLLSRTSRVSSSGRWTKTHTHARAHLRQAELAEMAESVFALTSAAEAAAAAAGAPDSRAWADRPTAGRPTVAGAGGRPSSHPSNWDPDSAPRDRGDWEAPAAPVNGGAGADGGYADGRGASDRCARWDVDSQTGERVCVAETEAQALALAALQAKQRAQGSLSAKRREVEELRRQLADTQATLHTCAPLAAVAALTDDAAGAAVQRAVAQRRTRTLVPASVRAGERAALSCDPCVRG